MELEVRWSRNVFKGFLLLVSPAPLRILLREIREWRRDLRIVLDHVAVIAGEAKELANFSAAGGRFPLADLLQVSWVRANALPAETVTQTGDLGLRKKTLLRIEFKTSLGYSAQDKVQMLQMFLHRARGDQDIIKKANDVLRWQSAEDEGH